MKGKMNETTKRVRTRFARKVRFDVKARSLRAEQTDELERLKNRLLKQLLDESVNPETGLLLQRAAHDAAALAWEAGYPLLIFPALLEERAQTALIQGERQTEVRRRSRNFLLEAA